MRGGPAEACPTWLRALGRITARAVLRPCLAPGLAFTPAQQACNRTSVATCKRAKTLFPEEEIPAPIRQPLSISTFDPVHQGKQHPDIELPLAFSRSWVGSHCVSAEGFFPPTHTHTDTHPHVRTRVERKPREGQGAFPEALSADCRALQGLGTRAASGDRNTAQRNTMSP